MKEKLVIGLDIGTSNVKAVIFDKKGKVIVEAEESLQTFYPEVGFAEQNPNEVEASCRRVIQEAVAQVDQRKFELVATGIGCAMHSLICVDENGEALSNMLIWSDGRASQQAEQLLSANGKEIYAQTGTPIHPMTPLLKLMWMRESHYAPYEEATYFMTMKEYLTFHWFGERLIDYAMASSTGMFNVKHRVWDREALELAGIREDQLSDIVGPTKQLKDLNATVAAEIGLPTAHPFIIGSADGQLANLGSGATSSGEVNISVGTSGAIRQFINGAPINEKMETFTYAFSQEMSIIGGPTNNGGIVLDWFKQLIGFDEDYTDLINTATDVAPGADGLLFLPYVNGERAPHWNQKAAGNFYGLRIGHKQAQLTRAVLEGIAFNIYHIGEALEKLAGKPKKITVNGGLTKSHTWVQILADLFGQDLYLCETHHNAAWGAAWTALVAIREADSFESIKANLPEERKITANLEAHEVYKKSYQKYVKLSDALSDFFK